MTLGELMEILGEFVDLGDVDNPRGLVLGEDIPIDSHDMLRAIARIEARSGLRFHPMEILAMRTLGDVLDAVERASRKRRA